MTDRSGDIDGRGPLAGMTVVVVGGSSGIGLAVAKQSRAQGAHVVITGRDLGRLKKAALEVGTASIYSFDAYDAGALEEFFKKLLGPINHVFVGAGSPYYAPLHELDLEKARASFDATLSLMLNVSRVAPPLMAPGGTMLFMGGTGARQPAVGMTVIGALGGASTAAVRNLALEVAPARINVIAAGFVDTPLSSRLLGEGLGGRRAQLARDLPIRRVVQAEDVAFLATHLMANTAITGAVIDIDGGQQVVSPGVA